MNTILKYIPKGYFAAVLYFSFTHLIEAAHKAGGTGAEAIAVPLLVDGMFVYAATMRSERWSSRTRRIGFRLQVIAGMASMTGNVYAAHSLFSRVFGAALPILVVAFEWLGDAKQLKTAKAEAAEQAAADAERIVREAAEAVTAKKAAAVAKGQATRAKNARTRKAQVKVLNTMLNPR